MRRGQTYEYSAISRRQNVIYKILKFQNRIPGQIDDVLKNAQPTTFPMYLPFKDRLPKSSIDENKKQVLLIGFTVKRTTKFQLKICQ